MESSNIVPPRSASPLPLYPKKSRWKKIVGTIVVAVVVVAALLYAMPRILSLIFPGDADLVDSSALQLQKVSVPDKQNGYFDLAKLTEDSIYIPEANKTFDIDSVSFTQPVTWDQRTVDDVLQRNAQPLSLLSQAAAKNYFQLPAYADPANLHAELEFYSFNTLRRVARLQAIKALSLSKQGKTNEALAEAAKLNKFGHNLIVGHNSLIGNLVGIAIQRLGSETILQILQSGTPGKGTLLNTLKTLEEPSSNLEGYKDAFRFEYTHMVNSIDETVNAKIQGELEQMVADGTVSPAWAKYTKYGYYYKPNHTKNLYTHLFNHELAAIGTACTLGELPELTENRATTWKLLFTENAIGRMLFSVTGISLGSVITKQCENDLALNVAKTELGLRLYKVDHGIVPQGLDKIAPDYMPSIPQDPYDKQPLRYNAKDKFLYSVGPNKQDLGGSQGEDWSKMENPTFYIAF